MCAGVMAQGTGKLPSSGGLSSESEIAYNDVQRGGSDVENMGSAVE